MLGIIRRLLRPIQERPPGQVHGGEQRRPLGPVQEGVAQQRPVAAQRRSRTVAPGDLLALPAQRSESPSSLQCCSARCAPHIMLKQPR